RPAAPPVGRVHARRDHRRADGGVGVPLERARAGDERVAGGAGVPDGLSRPRPPPAVLWLRPGGPPCRALEPGYTRAPAPAYRSPCADTVRSRTVTGASEAYMLLLSRSRWLRIGHRESPQRGDAGRTAGLEARRCSARCRPAKRR